MRLTVYNYKGGVGKTRIALNFAYTLGCGIVTNDMNSNLEDALEEKRLLVLEPNQEIPDLPDGADVIFDLGGYADDRAIKAVKMSECVLVPVIYDVSDMKTTLNFINEIKEYNSKVIVLANRTKGGNYKAIKNAVGKFFPEMPVFEIKKSQSMVHLFRDKISVDQMAKKFPLHRKHYEIVADQFTEIIKHINEG